MSILLCALLATTLVPDSVRAESDIAVHGIILDDSTGQAVEQARIRIDGTSFHTTSEPDGSFELRAVPLGTWTFVVERSGYHTRRLDGIDIVEGFSRNLYISLDPSPIVLTTQGVESESILTDGTRRVTLSTEQIGTRTVGQLLESIPGVRVYGSSDAPGGTRISVGGEPASRVAVMMDGLPLSGGSDGAVDLSSIPVSALTAIEIRAGSQSAIAGDAAVGGAVNLITRIDDRQDDIRISASGGDWGRSGQDLAVTQSLNSVTISAGGEYDQRHTPYKFVDINTDTTGMRQNARIDERRAYLRISSPLHRSFELLGYASRNERGAPGIVERPMLFSFTRNKNARVQSSREFSPSQSSRVVTALWYEFSSEYYSSLRTAIPQHSYLSEHFVGAKGSFSTVLLTTNSNTEVEARYRRIRGMNFILPDNSFGEEERGEYALRTRLNRQIWRFSASGGIALDVDEQTAPGWSPRFDFGFRPHKSVSLGLGWGRSFRRPLLMTAFWKTDYYTQGNPDLLPERAGEWDASIRFHFRAVTVDGRYFERTVNDIIVWDLRGVPRKFTPVNLSSARVVGREDHASIEVGKWWSFDYTHVFNDASDQNPERSWMGNTIVFVPRHTHDLTVLTSTGAMSLRLSSRWVSRRFTLRANSKWQKPYRAFDADLRISPSTNPNVVIFLRGENLTNEPIELLEGYPSPSRTLSAGVTLGIK